jgi:adenosylhomocysteine nucleosidase
VLFALDRESSPFRQIFSDQQRCADAPCRAWRCGRGTQTVMVVETGVGAAKTQRALDWLQSWDAPRDARQLLIAAGFAGALDRALQIGGVLVAREVVGPDGTVWPTTWPDANLAWEGSAKTGRLFCSPRLIGDAKEKKMLGEAHRVQAVDMESATVAQFCARHGMDFGCVRAISDDVDTSLSPHLASVLGGGQVSIPRLAWTLARHPSVIGPLLKLARATHQASHSLARSLDFLLGEGE